MLPSTGPPAGAAEWTAADQWVKRRPLLVNHGGRIPTSSVYSTSPSSWGSTAVSSSAQTDVVPPPPAMPERQCNWAASAQSPQPLGM